MTITHSSTRLVALTAGVAVAVALMFGAFAAPAKAALTEAQIQSIISLLQSFGADSTTITNVDASLRGQPTSGGSTGGTSGAAMCPYTWTRSLTDGSTGADVMKLQQFLNSMAGTQVASSGAGSPGSETSYFGPATKAAVIKFQNLYASEVLAPVGLSAGTGYFGPSSRAKANALCSTGGGSTGGGTTIPTGPGITINASAQPANALAPQGATRVPFTNFTLTNNTGSTVTVNSITVQRVGLGIDSNFSGIVLIDSVNNLQIGTAKTLNSNHQANIGDAFTLNPGESKSLTVAGNIGSPASVAGQIVSLNIVAINSSSPVSGSLPITGASHTINATLTLGSVSTTTSSFDPGANQSKNIGDSDIRVSGLRFTAGSAEALRLYSVRWRQVGTASAADIANVRTIVDGTSYPTSLSSDGKYYTTVFPGGLFIDKGNSIDLYNMVDIVGSNAASRTVAFDLDKVTDVYFIGQTYNYGVAPSGTYQPWFDSYTTTINAGTVTTIGKASEVPAQNVALNVPNQPLGGFVTDFKGEAVSVTQMVFNLGYSSDAASTNLITSISIVDENGSVVAGPVDGINVAGNQQKATFSDTVTFSTGRHVYTIKGKIPSTVTAGQTIIASTTPSGWSSPVGQTSGNTITISTGNFSMNTMTVKAAALVVSLSTTPSSQNIVAGAQSVLFANLQLDATQSGEDVRISAVPIRLTGTVANLNSCQVFDGSTPLNTGSNVPSSLSASGTATTFTFDNTITVPKGTVKTLALKCNVSSSASSTFVWSINSGDTWSSTGVTSGSSIGETFGNLTGGTMTIQSGSLALTVDSSSPSFSLAAGGTSGVTMAVLKLRASNEALTLTDLGLQLGAGSGAGSYGSTSTGSGGSPGSGTGDLTAVYVYDGASLVGTTVSFTGTTQSASSTGLSVNLPKDTDKLLTIKADLANIGTSYPGGIGNTIAVDPQGARASGSSSGTTVWAVDTTGTTAVSGVQLFKSYPTLALDSGSLSLAGGQLMRFKVTANSAGPVGVAGFSFKVASTSGVTITTVQLKAYSDASYSQPISGQAAGGLIGAAVANITSNTAFYIAPTTNPISIPANSTIYFELTGAVALSGQTSYSAVTTLLGDSAAATTLTSGYDVGTSTKAANSSTQGKVAATGANFIWSGNSTTTSAFGAAKDVDWTNGFSVPGLPAAGLIKTVN